jgi:DHA1 family bicyclomycin/chloramphenicol resistance-like MFS transporter
LTLAGIVTLALVYFLYEESNRALNVQAIEPRRFRDNYIKIFTNETCLGYIMVNAVNFGCLFSYIACSPLVMMGLLGISETNYGWTFAATGVSVMASSAINGKLASKGVHSRALLQFGLGISFVSALALVVVSFTLKPSLITILPLLVMNVFSSGFVSPNAAQATLHPVPEIAGVASAAISSTRMMFGAIAGLLSATLFDGHTARSMAIFMAVLSTAALALFWHVSRAHRRLLEH